MALPISGIGLSQAQPGVAGALPTPSSGATGGPSFGDTLKDALEEISAVQGNSREMVAAYLRGEPVELHQVMAAAEESGIALEMLVEVRNKLTEAYRTVINMQS
jgi:flagellar hook-basal body complex protein FliE